MKLLIYKAVILLFERSEILLAALNTLGGLKSHQFFVWRGGSKLESADECEQMRWVGDIAAALSPRTNIYLFVHHIKIIRADYAWKIERTRLF
jgi:Ser/Thr protein kinase RdoA (MazF antagonist)